MERKKGRLYEWDGDNGREIGIKYPNGEYQRIHCGGVVTIWLQKDIGLDVGIEMDMDNSYYAHFDDENGFTRNLTFLNSYTASLPGRY